MSVRKRVWISKGVEKTAWVVDYKDGGGKRRQRTFPTKKEADTFRDSTGVAVRAGLHVADSASITVEEAGERWIECGEVEELEASTIRQRRNHVDLHINPAIGDVKLSRLSAPDVSAFVTEFRAANSLAMTRKVLASLKTLISHAVTSGAAAQNVAREVKPPKAKKREQKKINAGRDFPDKAEMAAMLEAATAMSNSIRRAYPLVLIAAHTGLRISEILGLRWSSVDFDTAEITVSERLDSSGSHGDPKSEDSARVVPIPPTLLQALREWKIACPKGKAGLVFPNGKGNAEFQGNIWRRVLLPVQERAGVALDTGAADSEGKPVVAVKYGLHSFRHSYCSMLIDGGATPKRVQNLMGHATLAMTMDKYGHLFPDEKLADQVGAIFG